MELFSNFTWKGGSRGNWRGSWRSGVKVSNSLNNVVLYLLDGLRDFEKVLPPTLKPLPATRRIHQVNSDKESQRSDMFLRWTKNVSLCQSASFCFWHWASSMDNQRYSAAPKENVLRSLAQLLMEKEEEPQWGPEGTSGPEGTTGPEGTSTGITAQSIKPGDWMAVVYDEHWWLARAVSVDGENQDARVESLHPHGPSE